MRQDFVAEFPPLPPTPKSGSPTGVTNEPSEAMDLQTRLMMNILLARPDSAHEIASAALFLAASASSDITGHALPIDGGLRKGLLT